MKIPFKFTHRDISLKELSDANFNFLKGTMTEDQKWIIDAVLSWFQIENKKALK